MIVSLKVVKFKPSLNIPHRLYLTTIMKTVPNADADKIDFQTLKTGTMRKFLQNLQPSSGGKENLVGAGRTPQDMAIDDKTLKPEVTINETQSKSKDKPDKSSVAKVNPSLYKKLIIEDLTSTAGPSEKYWEVIAERRRKALEEVLEENRHLHAIISALKEENKSCKTLLEQSTDLVNTLKEIMNEDQFSNDDDSNSLNDQEDSGLSTPDSYSSTKHVHKKMKISNSDDDVSDSD